MTTFEKNPHDRLTRRCIHCGTPFHSHAEGTQECPQRYRPGSLEEAERSLRLALERNDQGAVFVARGEVQRLGGDPDKVRPVAYTSATGEDWVEAEPYAPGPTPGTEWCMTCQAYLPPMHHPVLP